jgi:short-subunit dehydrogenase
MLLLNIFPIAILTKGLILNLLHRRYRSAIINLGSVVSIIPFPYLPVYTSTKAFDDTFSRSLVNEFKFKIDIMSFRPHAVLTKGSE